MLMWANVSVRKGLVIALSGAFQGSQDAPSSVDREGNMDARMAEETARRTEGREEGASEDLGVEG